MNIKDFPYHVFPLEYQEYINSQHDKDYYAGAILGAVSGLSLNKFVIEYKPTWTETALLYMILVGGPGTGKTQAMYNVLNSINQLSSTTIEHLVNFISKKPTGTMIVKDEINQWVNGMNYRNGNDSEFWLECWNNNNILIDTKVKTKYLKRLYVTVIGSMYPGTISNIMKDWAERLLFVYPNQKAISKPAHNIKNNKQEYKMMMNRIYELPSTFDENNKSIQFKMNDKAKQVYDSLKYTNIEMRYILRFALILKLLDISVISKTWTINELENENIDAEHIHRAIEISKYFIDTRKSITS